MKVLEKKVESKVKIRFVDCDPFNHLNNSKYIDYIINAREDQLLNYYNFDVYKLAREQGISWVVAQNQIVYLMPAVLMETVVIETQLIYADTKNLMVEAFMWDEEKVNIKAILWTKLVHFDLKAKKSQIHSDELMKLFKEVENPIEEILNFDTRIKNIRNSQLTSKN